MANDRVRFHTRRCLAVLCSPVFVPEEQGTETLPGWQPCTTQLCVELLLFTVQSIVGNNGDLPRQALNRHITFESEKMIERNGARKGRVFVCLGWFVCFDAQTWPSGRGYSEVPGRIFISKIESSCWTETG